MSYHPLEEAGYRYGAPLGRASAIPPNTDFVLYGGGIPVNPLAHESDLDRAERLARERAAKAALAKQSVLEHARQRLAEVESQLTGHDALVAERDMLRRMIEAAEAVTR